MKQKPEEEQVPLVEPEHASIKDDDDFSTHQLSNNLDLPLKDHEDFKKLNPDHLEPITTSINDHQPPPATTFDSHYQFNGQQSFDDTYKHSIVNQFDYQQQQQQQFLQQPEKLQLPLNFGVVGQQPSISQINSLPTISDWPAIGQYYNHHQDYDSGLNKHHHYDFGSNSQFDVQPSIGYTLNDAKLYRI